jgi:hypothetical protein
MGLEVNKYVPVGEYREDVDTGVFLKNGDFLDLSTSGTIWAGVGSRVETALKAGSVGTRLPIARCPGWLLTACSGRRPRTVIF